MGEEVVLPFKEGRGSGRYIVAMVIVSGSYILFFNFIINKHKRNLYHLGQVSSRRSIRMRQAGRRG